VVDDLLARMRNNAAGDWKIDDIERLCRLHGIDCKPPAGGGSHYKVSHAAVAEILTIPARRPIKPRYISLLVRFVRIVIASQARSDP
jgi:hypothetical protein